MLRRRPETLGFAVDDAHLRPEHPGWNGGWIVVNAAERTPERILEAIRRGNFYASCGPEFHAIRHDGGYVEIETSPVQFIRLVGPAYRGDRLGSFDDQRLTGARFAVPAEWDYAYLEIEDDRGRRAWTNTLFAEGSHDHRHRLRELRQPPLAPRPLSGGSGEARRAARAALVG